MSDARKKQALDEVTLHNDWFLRHFLFDDQTIMVVPRYKLDYRDEYLPCGSTSTSRLSWLIQT